VLSTTAGSALPARKEAGQVISYAAWSPSALYLAFRVDDPMIVGNQTLWLGQPWQDDAIAIYLQLSPQESDTLTPQSLRVVISAAGGISVQRGEQGAWRDDPTWFDPLSQKGTIRYAVKILDGGKVNETTKPANGYQAELALSWDLLGVRPPVGMGPHGELPCVRCAVVNYSQGETQSVSCWPENLAAADLTSPSRWGQLQFGQDLRPIATQARLVNATRLPGDLHIDAQLDPIEWMTAGIVTFKKQWGDVVIPRKTERQAVSLVSAWYQLDPFAAASYQRPWEPTGPWAGADTPIYHQEQIREARRAGIDAFAVILPADPRLREQTRTRLLALRSALHDYAGVSAETTLWDTPLLLPVLDLSGAGNLDLKQESGERALIALLEDFYHLIPPQYRTMVPGGANQPYCYPVVLTAPTPGVQWDDTFTARLTARLQAEEHLPVGWILDSGWKGEKGLPHVLMQSDFSPTAGAQLSEGAMLSALVSPGAGNVTRDTLPRRGGETLSNNWVKLIASRPDFVLIHSWNGFSLGSAVAPSRADGYQCVDSLRVSTLQLAAERGFGVCLLRHDLPATLLPGKAYPVELLLKNGGTQQLTAKEGYRVDYRVVRAGETQLSGSVSERIMLLPLTGTRMSFTLPTGKDRNPLAPGTYELQLDFLRNKIAFLNTPLFREKIGTLSIPFTIAATADAVQLVTSETPEALPTGAHASVQFGVRQTSAATAHKGTVAFHLRWLSEQGVPLSKEITLPWKSSVATGEVMAVRGETPPAPTQPGWYLLALQRQQENEEPVTIATTLIRVVAADIRAEFCGISLPRNITGSTPVDTAVLIRNRGLSPWKAKDLRITYQWLTWDGQAIPDAQGAGTSDDDVRSGEKALIHLMVQPPTGAGSLRCAFGVEYAGQRAELFSDPTDILQPVVSMSLNAGRYQLLDLQDLFTKDRWAAYADTVVDRLDFDGAGNAFPLEEFLPNASVPPLGYQATYASNAPSFRFAAPTNNRAPYVIANAQTLSLDGTPASMLYLVAATTAETHQVSFRVQYADGTTKTTDITVANWLGDPAKEEPVLLKTRHIHAQTGDNWYVHGSLFVYAIPLDPRRKATGLMLPQAPDIAIFAATLDTAVAH
jgi:hypothetical protein